MMTIGAHPVRPVEPTPMSVRAVSLERSSTFGSPVIRSSRRCKSPAPLCPVYSTLPSSDPDFLLFLRLLAVSATALRSLTLRMTSTTVAGAPKTAPVPSSAHSPLRPVGSSRIAVPNRVLSPNCKCKCRVLATHPTDSFLISQDVVTMWIDRVANRFVVRSRPY